MTRPIWLVYNLLGDNAMCNTYDQALSMAKSYDKVRMVHVMDGNAKYPSIIMRCSRKQAEKEVLNIKLFNFNLGKKRS